MWKIFFIFIFSEIMLNQFFQFFFKFVEDANFKGIVEHKDASPEERLSNEVNMSTYLFQTPDLLESLSLLKNNNSQAEYYLTDCARLLRESGRPVAALPALQPCESLSINNPDELQLVDQQMRSMGYA